MDTPFTMTDAVIFLTIWMIMGWLFFGAIGVDEDDDL